MIYMKRKEIKLMENILKIPNKILIRKFNIEFSYITKRNNKRIRTIEIKATDKESAEYWFSQWVEGYNSENPHKTYSNVQILGCVEIDREVIEIK